MRATAQLTEATTQLETQYESVLISPETRTKTDEQLLNTAELNRPAEDDKGAAPCDEPNDGRITGQNTTAVSRGITATGGESPVYSYQMMKDVLASETPLINHVPDTKRPP